MEETTEYLTLLQRLAKIRTIADAVARNKRGYNYSYAEITQILAKVTTGMKNYRVSLIPSVVPNSTSVEQKTLVNTKTDKEGNRYDQTVTEFMVQSEMTFRWVNDDDRDDFIEVPWVVIGMQSDPSQAFGSGLTYCTRYFLTNYFQIGQDNDVDSYRSKQRAAEQEEAQAVLRSVLDEIDTAVRAFLTEHPDKREDVLNVIRPFAKDGNYKKIKDPAAAGKLLKELTAFVEKA